MVLRVRPVGEIHAGVEFLGRQSGLIDAMAYGARSRKGSLRGLVVPFGVGTGYFYTDPVKGSTKVTDLAIDNYHPELRENLKKFYVATLWTELTISSYAAGSEGEEVWTLLSSGLDLLSRGEEATADLVNLQFLWRFLGLLGMRPELPDGSGRQIYRPEEHRFVPAIAESEAGYTRDPRDPESFDEQLGCSAGSLAYLAESSRRDLADSLSLNPSGTQRGELKVLLFRLIQEASERELKTIRSGRGIL